MNPLSVILFIAALVVSVVWIIFPFRALSLMTQMRDLMKEQRRFSFQIAQSSAKAATAAAHPAARTAPDPGIDLFPGHYYFLDRARQQQGPFTPGQMREFFQAGRVNWETPVREERDEEWGTIGNFVGVAG